MHILAVLKLVFAFRFLLLYDTPRQVCKASAQGYHHLYP